MRKIAKLIAAILRNLVLQPNAEKAWGRIDSLDFTVVKRKLMEPAPEGQGWNQQQADAAEKWYRRFLKVCAKYPKHFTVPNGPIDAFWHQHILDTQAYEEDCFFVFGCLLHHYPYYGMNGDAEERDADFVLTNDIYQHEFGETCLQMPEFLGKEEVSMNCGHGGGGTGCGQRCKSSISAKQTTKGRVCGTKQLLKSRNCGNCRD